MNLIEGLHEQMNRARRLRTDYEDVPMGFIGTQIIDLKIAQAERSIESGDAVAMLDAYGELEALE